VRTLRRVGALGVLAVVALLALAGTASADPGTEYVAGYGGAGRVCVTRAGYDWATIGKWWPGQSRPGVPRG
jgi:hypothetical protein